MVAIANHLADGFLKSIDLKTSDPKLCAVLFYGPDAGLVSERALRLARAMANREKPPGDIMQMEDADLEEDSGRLTLELQTMPMFGGRKIIRARAGRRINTPLVKSLLEQGGLQGFLIVEAGELKKDEGLRGLFDKSVLAAGVACYPDSEADLAHLARTVLKGHGLTISSDVLDLLVARIGSDRVVSRGEIDKLALYCMGRTSVEADDIDAVVGETSDLKLDAAPEAAAAGQGTKAVFDAGRCVAAGDGSQAVLLATQRYFLRLHRLRATIDQGRSADDVVRTMRPPMPPQVQAQLKQHCQRWSTPKLTTALGEIATTIKASRQTGAPSDILTERLLLRLSMMAGR